MVESADVLELRSEMPGEAVLTYIVPEGTRVKRGDLLAKLDDSARREALLQQQIAVTEAAAATESAILAPIP